MTGPKMMGRPWSNGANTVLMKTMGEARFFKKRISRNMSKKKVFVGQKEKKIVKGN